MAQVRTNPTCLDPNKFNILSLTVNQNSAGCEQLHWNSS